MFLYITLFFQNVLGYSPFQAGLRSLPVTMPILFVSPLSGRLTARVPVRLLLGTGLAFVACGVLLMANLSDTSGWTVLLPGQILSGIGIGLATPALASTAVGVVPRQLSGRHPPSLRPHRPLESPLQRGPRERGRTWQPHDPQIRGTWWAGESESRVLRAS